MSDEKVCKHIKIASREIWSKLEKSKKYKMDIKEETLTDITLLYLAEKLEKQVRTKAFNRIEEGGNKRNYEEGNGADWEWYIQQNKMWIGFRVQAKRIDNKTRYPIYANLLKKPNEGRKFQIETLINEAHNDGLIPIYCFYNFIDNAHLVDEYAKKRGMSDGRIFEKELVGWTYTEAFNVLQFHKKNVRSIRFHDLMENNDIIANLFCHINIKDYVAGLNELRKQSSEDCNLYGLVPPPKFETKRLSDLPKYVRDVYENKGDIDDSKYDDAVNVFIVDLDTVSSGSIETRKYRFWKRLWEKLKKLFNFKKTY